MKPSFVLLWAVWAGEGFVGFSATARGQAQERKMADPNKEVSAMLENVRWLGHAGFQIKGSKAVVVDPYQIAKVEAADVILVTHDHYDHCSLEDIRKVKGKNTVLVAQIGRASYRERV